MRASTTASSPFDLHKAHVFRKGGDITLLGTGIMTVQLLLAAEQLTKTGIDAEVIHVPVIKPLDTATVIASISKTGLAVTAEEAQVAAGFGAAILEAIAEDHPTPTLRIGIHDQFGESGEPSQLMKHFGLDVDSIVNSVSKFYNQHK